MTENLDAALLRAVETFHRRLREASTHLMRDVECSRSSAAIVRLVARHPMQVGDLAQVLRVDVSVASRQVGLLVDEGLVERTVDEVDRRARVLRLTAAGEARAGSIQATLERRVGALFSDWTEQDVTTAIDVLGRLAASIDAYPVLEPAG